MAKKKAKDTTKKTDDADQSDIDSKDDNAQPGSVEAAYWEGKVKKTSTKKGEKTGEPKTVEDYSSNIMVTAKPNESSEQLLRRFNRQVRDLNLIDEIRDRLEYEKPSQRRKREKRERIANARRYQRYD